MKWRQVAGLENQQHKDVFDFLCDTMTAVGLSIVDNNHKETLEVHLTEEDYKNYAFASIQSSGGNYIELRFPKQHLEKKGLLELLAGFNGCYWGHPSEKYIRFRFEILNDSSRYFILMISSLVKKNI